MIDEIAALIVQALQDQCGEDVPRIVADLDDDRTQVDVEGCFDIRAVALAVLAGLPKEATGPVEANAVVRLDPETNELKTYLIGEIAS